MWYCLNIKATLLFQNASSENEMVSNLSLQVDDVFLKIKYTLDILLKEVQLKINTSKRDACNQYNNRHRHTVNQ